MKDCNCIYMTSRNDEDAQICSYKNALLPYCVYTTIGAKRLCKHYKEEKKDNKGD